tara:strand:- start:275 stop:505 length:231 start_codon:yes stop_codon:yes gene_type:complete
MIKKNSELVTKYLNNIYVIGENFKDIDIRDLEELLNDIDDWKICCEEIEFKIKSHHQFYSDVKPQNNIDDNKLIIF